MPRHLDPVVTVEVPIGAHLLRRLDAVAADLGLDRSEALHAALLLLARASRAQNRRPRPYAHDAGVDEDPGAHRHRVRTPTC